jgi:hypothetical protein
MKGLSLKTHIEDTAVLLCNGYPSITINGAIIDVFEYYFAILEHNKDVKLYLIDFDNQFKDYLINLMEERYYLDDLKWKENIVQIKRFNIVKYQFGRVLIIDYTTIKKLRGILKAKHLDIITEITVISDLHTDNPEYMFRKDLYNVTYYGEMPFVYKDVQYQMKLLFDRFKPLGDVQEGYYIQAPGNKQANALPSILNLNRKFPIYFKQEKHMKNLFEHFTSYIYYHSNDYFDPHPRLPVESCFYKKQVMYYNQQKIKDGSYYRFKDLNDHGIKNRFLNKDDEIVRLFI